jgi:hypothetical protein
MRVRTNVHGNKLIDVNDDTCCVVYLDGRYMKLNQKLSNDEFNYKTVYISKEEIIQLAEELKKL